MSRSIIYTLAAFAFISCSQSPERSVEIAETKIDADVQEAGRLGQSLMRCRTFRASQMKQLGYEKEAVLYLDDLKSKWEIVKLTHHDRKSEKQFLYTYLARCASGREIDGIVLESIDAK